VEGLERQDGHLMRISFNVALDLEKRWEILEKIMQVSQNVRPPLRTWRIAFSSEEEA